MCNIKQLFCYLLRFIFMIPNCKAAEKKREWNEKKAALNVKSFKFDFAISFSFVAKRNKRNKLFASGERKNGKVSQDAVFFLLFILCLHDSFPSSLIH